MDALILNADTLPMSIREKIHAPKVSVQERDGGVVLMPVNEDCVDLWGILPEGKLTSEKFLHQKRQDKDLDA